eukprot:scaffold99752_cov63-Phaeocystis_antarctica.AAC.1
MSQPVSGLSCLRTHGLPTSRRTSPRPTSRTWAPCSGARWRSTIPCTSPRLASRTWALCSRTRQPSMRR